jgi:hypothetical protein
MRQGVEARRQIQSRRLLGTIQRTVPGSAAAGVSYPAVLEAGVDDRDQDRQWMHG